MKGLNFPILLLSLMVILCGCVHLSPTTTTTSVTANAALARFWKEQELRRKELNAFEGKLRIEWKSKNQTLMGTGRILSTSQGLRLELRDPLGRLQILITSHAKKFSAYIPSQNEAYVDRYQGRAYVSEFLNLDLDFLELADLWLGILNPEWQRAIGDSSSIQESATAITANASLEGRKLRMDLNKEDAALLRLKYETGSKVFELGYEDFAPCCGNLNQSTLSVAHSVLSRDASSNDGKDKGGQVEVEWLEIAKAAPGQKESAFQSSLPAGVSVKELK